MCGFNPPTGDFRVDNPFWNGMTTLNTQLKPTAIDSLSNLPPNPEGTTLLIVPYEQFSSIELQEIKTYVSGGGTLVLLDDYGYGNQSSVIWNST